MQDTAQAHAVDFKAAMRRLTSTVSLISTFHHGQRYGMAATAVQSVSADPPSLLVCVNRSASIHRPLSACRRFAVNVLHVSHANLVPPFSARDRAQERFDHGDWTELDSLPVLTDAQAVFICTLEASMSFGSHDIVVGSVKNVRTLPEVAPLLYGDGKFSRAQSLP